MVFTPTKEQKVRGFTLIELLVVVISIIGLLSSVVLTSLNGVRVKARNAQRISEILELVKAFNLAQNSDPSNNLPSTGGNWVCVSAACTQGWAGYAANADVDAAITPYISKPSDPSGGTRGNGG